jgi:transcriptional regulator GlxA family with amidase domain
MRSSVYRQPRPPLVAARIKAARALAHRRTRRHRHTYLLLAASTQANVARENTAFSQITTEGLMQSYRPILLQRISITALIHQVHSRASANRRIELVVETVQNNLHLDLSFDELANSVNLSPSRLRHLFKEVTGVSLHQYVKLPRMHRAAYLLRTEFLTVKIVLTKVGIKDESHFVRFFKQIYRLTPAQYRDHYAAQRETDAGTDGPSGA